MTTKKTANSAAATPVNKPRIPIPTMPGPIEFGTRRNPSPDGSFIDKSPVPELEPVVLPEGPLKVLWTDQNSITRNKDRRPGRFEPVGVVAVLGESYEEPALYRGKQITVRGEVSLAYEQHKALATVEGYGVLAGYVTRAEVEVR